MTAFLNHFCIFLETFLKFSPLSMRFSKQLMRRKRVKLICKGVQYFPTHQISVSKLSFSVNEQ